MSDIPKAFAVLKKDAGTLNWMKLRRTFVRFLTIKRDIQSLKSFTYLQRLLYAEFYQLIENIEYDEATLSRDSIISHARNALNALRLEPYNRAWMCYITDSYNTSPKSGNKKYINC